MSNLHSVPYSLFIHRHFFPSFPFFIIYCKFLNHLSRSLGYIYLFRLQHLLLLTFSFSFFLSIFFFLKKYISACYFYVTLNYCYFLIRWQYFLTANLNLCFKIFEIQKKRKLINKSEKNHDSNNFFIKLNYVLIIPKQNTVLKNPAKRKKANVI